MTASRLLHGGLLWYALLGAPLAWTGQLVVGYGVEEAACSEVGMRWGIGVGTWQVALTAAAATVAAGGVAVAFTLRRDASRGSGDPRGRTSFLASAGLLVSAVFLVLILLGGIAAIALPSCEQG